MTSTPPQPNTGDERLRADLMHILLTGEKPQGNFRVAAPSLDIAKQIDAIMQAFKAELGAARLDEVRNAKVVHIDMPTEGIKKRFDDWCFIRQEEITDGKPAGYKYEAREIDDYNRRFKS